MAKIYNEGRALAEVKLYLFRNKIFDFTSLTEVINFEKELDSKKQQIIEHQTHLLNREKNDLEREIKSLRRAISLERSEYTELLDYELAALENELEFFQKSSRYFFKKTFNKIVRWTKQKRIQILQKSIASKVEKFIEPKVLSLEKKTKRFNSLSENFIELVDTATYPELDYLDSVKWAINKVQSSILSAIGEHKVLEELKKLSDNYVVINDFVRVFDPPICNYSTKEYTQSVQIDHIVIATSGVFIIESINWSSKSRVNKDLQSTIKQLEIKMLAANVFLDRSNSSIYRNNLGLNSRIYVNPILVVINCQPELVKGMAVLSLKELRNYIESFPPIFSNDEMDRLELVFHLNNTKKSEFSIFKF